MGDGTIFFSYSRKDSDFVLDLARELRSSGANIWLDQLDIEPGTAWDDSIEEALDYAKKLLASRKKHYSDNPRSLYLGYAALSSAYNAKEEYSKGLENQLIAFELVREGYGSEHPTFGINSANLAFSYHNVGRDDLAIHHQQQALDVFAKTYKPNHFLIVRGNIRMGTFHLARSEVVKSKEYRDKAAILLEQIDPENRRDLPEMLNNLNSEIAAFEN